MDWDDVDNILFEGGKAEIDRLRCPDCQGQLAYHFNPEFGSFKVSCLKCKTFTSAHKMQDKPKCVELYGNDHEI